MSTMDEAKLSEIEARALVAEVRRLQKANEALVAAFDAALARSHDRITVSGHRAIVPQIGNVLLTRIERAAW